MPSTLAILGGQPVRTRPFPNLARLRRPRTRAARGRPHFAKLGRLPEPQSQSHRVRRRIRRIPGRSLRHPDHVRHQRARGRTQSTRHRRRRRGYRPGDHFRRDPVCRRRMHGASGLRRRQRCQRMRRSGIRRASHHASHQGHHPRPLRCISRRSRRPRGNFARAFHSDRRRLRPRPRRPVPRSRRRHVTAPSDASVFSPPNR